MSLPYALLAAASAAVSEPPTLDANGRPTLFGHLTNVYWAAFPGCLGHRSTADRMRYEALVQRLRATRPAVVARYGLDVINQFERAHDDATHGVYYIRCPEVNSSFNQQLRRAIEQLELHIAHMPTEP